MPNLYVLVGVPGSGKSTWVKNQDWAVDVPVVSTDNFVEAYAHMQGKTYSEVFEDYMPIAVRLMVNQVEVCKANGTDIIWDQTSTTLASRNRKFAMLPEYYAIAVVFPTPHPLELANRLKNRPGKEVPQQVINSMITGWEPPTEAEGFKEIWTV